ncbi:iron chelate uptake ABC transporter family permease subunit [Qingshengfaniella alkalisoli]|uniref:Iron chelate uptake ABC transporter family permease subunit n=1 Tax=Qingshengfaniella alkalisoli TaxID=2599296 RepID=A0A5B8IDC0_9RHOB|nr:iron chelate uptake ABC transporter family permease subunit [Qingshengfaniella alkalisoli]QDY71676.1 iron chelate uptake ABC transporter family permease subunit [Qingshengfaniella alkalisoli]
MLPDTGWRIAALAGLGLIAAAMFMTIGIPPGAFDFAIAFRGTKLAGLILVAYAIGVSTVLFHTVTGNRILTPSIMGFDALYLLVQIGLVFTLGGSGMLAIPEQWKFVAEVILMMGFASALFLWLFGESGRSLHLTLLVGIIFGVLFRSLSSFMSRLIDPSEFVVVQGASFASFNAINEDLLMISAVLCLATLPFLWSVYRKLDVLALGRDHAINLGLSYRRLVLTVLCVVAMLVSVSTALVGPITFFGLLVAHLTYIIVGDSRHGATLPAVVLVSAAVLIGGQAVFEHVLGLQGALSIVIDFLGGLVFLFLLLRGYSR